MNSTSQLIYIYDPMCSWCWAHRPQWKRLEKRLQDQLDIRYLLGGLTPESSKKMPKSHRSKVAAQWRKIQHQFETDFNFDFWQSNAPKFGTYRACRAVIAARWQQAEQAMILAIQKAFFLRALDPNDDKTLQQLATELSLDVETFMHDIHSQKLEDKFKEERQLAKSLAGNRMPTMILIHNHQLHSVPLDYKDSFGAYAFIDDLLQTY